jgi:hypothetical protein
MQARASDLFSLRLNLKRSRAVDLVRSLPGFHRVRFTLTGLRHIARRLLGRSTVVSLGDSHSQIVAGTGDMVIVHLGPVTMHRVGRPGELEALVARWCEHHRIGWRRLGVRVAGRRDIMLFSFGEIDVRCHVGRQLETGRSLDDVIESLVVPFLDQASALTAALGCTVAVLEIPPPSDIPGDADMPVVGVVEDRVRWTAMGNTALRELAPARGMRVVATPSVLVDDRGCLKREYSDGSVHLGGADAASMVINLLRRDLLHKPTD